METSSPAFRTASVLNLEQNRKVTETAGRLLHLLALLQRRPSWSGQELADRLDVDTRTVRRDVDRIRNLGYRIDSTPGTGGGYRLGVSTDMPPLLLDEEEAMAVAVLLGVSAGVAVPGIERATLATLARGGQAPAATAAASGQGSASSDRAPDQPRRHCAGRAAGQPGPGLRGA